MTPREAAIAPGATLWRNRDFLLLWSAQGISATGSRITRTALPMAAILVAGAGAYDLALLTVAMTLPGVVFAWLGGGIVDRHRRRPLLIGADIVRAMALAAIPLSALAGWLSLPILYAVAMVTGVASVLFDLADHVFITGLVPQAQLLDANGKREAVDAFAEISGPALGGALVSWLTAPIAIAADAVTFVVSAWLIGRIGQRESVAAPHASHSFLADARTGIRVVMADPAVRVLFVATSTLTFAMSFMASLYTLFALRDLGLSPTALGIAIGCGGIGGIAGAVLAAPVARRWDNRRTLVGSLLVGAAMQALIPLAPLDPAAGFLFLVVAQIFGDGALTIYLINETTLRQRLLPPEALGRAAATWKVAAGMLTPIGAVAGAALAETAGMRPALWMLVIGTALAALIIKGAGRALPSRRADETAG